jgi:hypothetical protein
VTRNWLGEKEKKSMVVKRNALNFQKTQTPHYFPLLSLSFLHCLHKIMEKPNKIPCEESLTLRTMDIYRAKIHMLEIGCLCRSR